jgi:hypothetical protein
MKTIILLLCAALALSAAEIQVIVRNDAGATVTSVTLKTTDEVFVKLNQWRLAQIVSCTPAVKPGDPCTPVLKFPTVGDFLRWIVREAFMNILRSHPPDSVVAQEAIANTATVKAAKLREAAIQ